MSMKKTYWKGLDEKHQSPEFIEKSNKEFKEDLPIGEFLADEGASEFKTGRRDFLKFLGFGVAAATLASCEAPVIKSIPYVNKPEDITPGVANWYSSTFYDGNDFSNILVKAREGRPIWVKGNSSFGLTKGGMTPRVAASVLNLYNGERLKGAYADGVEATWTDVDSSIKSKLKGIVAKGGNVRLLTNTIISPSTQLVINDFMSSLGGGESSETAVLDADGIAVMNEDGTPKMEASTSVSSNVSHVQYDAVSYSALRKANSESFSKNVIPDYDFSKAKVVVSIDADFLANWLLPTKFKVDFSVTRKPENGWMSKHYHFDSVFSLTGANADVRTPIKPSEQGLVASAILKAVTGKDLGISIPENITAVATKIAKDLKAAKGESLVVAGINNTGVQVIVNAINHALGNYGKTIDLDNPLQIKQADDALVENLVKEVEAGKVDALLMYGVNPVYTLPNGSKFGEALANVDLTVSFSEYSDETASLCHYNCPTHNFLESWNDLNPKSGVYSIQQPIIRPLYDTRQVQDSLLVWAGKTDRADRESKAYYNYIKAAWNKYGFSKQTKYASFDEYWNWAVHNGSADATLVPTTAVVFNDTTSNAAKSVKELAAVTGDLEVVMYQKVEMGEGQYAANPWLQELPDAMTKVTWDNYITMAPSDCYTRFGLSGGAKSQWDGVHLGQEDKAYVATITVGDQKLKLPVVPTPGQKVGTVGIALGYGRGANGEKIGRAAYQVRLDSSGKYLLDEEGNKTPIGGNSYRFTNFTNGELSYNAVGTFELSEGERYYMACTQTHHTVMGRDSIVKETTLDTFVNGNKEDYNHSHSIHIHQKGHDVHQNPNDFGLWQEHPVEHVGHRWGMSIDLTSCDGCGVCIIACHSENNVPVVGKDEVRRARDMHWLRMDRYFSTDEDENKRAYDENPKENDFDYSLMEIPEDNPSVVFMPMMCQHCNHAPCETVCPVAATTHSSEGLNMMAYNRCIGTRYCANNCPYKVRRFNWFNYRDYKKFDNVNITHDETARLALNPDVVVRSRGVMEKCSFCVQRIQEGKLNAKKEGRVLVDGDVAPACADACHNGSITFGDWNDTTSEVRGLSQNDRAYQALEEIGIKPNVWYQVKVNNVEESGHTEAHAEVEENHGH